MYIVLFVIVSLFFPHLGHTADVSISPDHTSACMTFSTEESAVLKNAQRSFGNDVLSNLVNDWFSHHSSLEREKKKEEMREYYEKLPPEQRKQVDKLLKGDL